MLFNSYVFILLFLPVALIGYFGLNYWGKDKAAKAFLVAMSLWFYAYFEPKYLFIILGSIGINYVISGWTSNRHRTVSFRKIMLVLGILLNVATIFYFKYFNFFLENINWIFGAGFVEKNILMPLGISFFTFQQISYLVDAYKGETKSYTFLDYALFVSFFPQLVAGPIVLHNEMIPQFNEAKRKRINQDLFSRGIWIFAIGLFKKVMIADNLGKAADFGFGNVESIVGVNAWVVMLCYTLQLYFDFSGYCDMAIGVANMFHMELPVNFDSPYKALSITEFWKRWHMTLTRFLRKYVYFPLGGSRKGYGRTLLNIMIVYLISGIWHGAQWTFVLWGLCHGALRVVEKICWPVLERVPKILRWVSTFLLVNFTWVLFRAETVSDAICFYRNMWNGWNLGIQAELLAQFELLEFTYVVEHVGILFSFVNDCPWIYMAIVLLGTSILAFIPKNCHEKVFVPTIGRAVGCILLLVWSVMSFSGISTFLYFNF